MGLFYSTGIAKRLYLVSGVLSLALAGVAVFAYFNLSNITSMVHRAEDVRVPQLRRIASTELNVTRVSLQLGHSIVARNPQEMNTALADIGEKRKLIEQAMGDSQKSLFTAKGREMFAKVPPLVDKFWAVGKENIKLIQDGQKAEAFAFLVDKTRCATVVWPRTRRSCTCCLRWSTCGWCASV